MEPPTSKVLYLFLPCTPTALQSIFGYSEETKFVLRIFSLLKRDNYRGDTTHLTSTQTIFS
jgi:hypothetical protein